MENTNSTKNPVEAVMHNNPTEKDEHQDLFPGELSPSQDLVWMLLKYVSPEFSFGFSKTIQSSFWSRIVALEIQTG